MKILKTSTNLTFLVVSIVATLVQHVGSFEVTSSGPVQIEDYLTSTVPIHVSENFIIDDIDVIVRIDHTCCGDLSLTLTAPNGTVVGLLKQPGSCTDWYSDQPITFDDSSPNDPQTLGDDSNLFKFFLPEHLMDLSWQLPNLRI